MRVAVSLSCCLLLAVSLGSASITGPAFDIIKSLLLLFLVLFLGAMIFSCRSQSLLQRSIARQTATTDRSPRPPAFFLTHRDGPMTTLRQKYEPVLQLVKDYAAQGGEVWEEDGMLHIRATVETAYERDSIREKIIAIGGDVPPDLEAEVRVRDAHAEDAQQTERTIRRVAHRYYPRRDASATG